MELTIRLSGDLGRLVGVPRVTVTLDDDATVADVLDSLVARHPQLARELRAAVPVVGGVHASPGTPLSGQREIALLTPVAGGSRRGRGPGRLFSTRSHHKE